MPYDLSLYQKLKLLLIIYLSKFNLIKLRWVCKPIPINERIEGELNKVGWSYTKLKDFSLVFKFETLGDRNRVGEQYKKLTDPTGEYRFYIPSLNDKVIWRVNLDYKGLPLPLILNTIVTKDGNKNKEVYEAVSNGVGLEKFKDRLGDTKCLDIP